MYKDITLDSIVDIFIRYFYSVSVRYTESLSNVTCQVDAIGHVQPLSLLSILYYYIYIMLLYILYIYIYLTISLGLERLDDVCTCTIAST